jgi:molecular chaperone GrpE (heat shock protein)
MKKKDRPENRVTNKPKNNSLFSRLQALRAAGIGFTVIPPDNAGEQPAIYDGVRMTVDEVRALAKKNGVKQIHVLPVDQWIDNIVTIKSL